MSGKRISVVATINLVGSGGFPDDWRPLKQFWELERAEKKIKRRTVSLTSAGSIFPSEPTAYEQANKQFKAVTDWLNDHGFPPLMRDARGALRPTKYYDLSKLNQALAEDPLKPPPADKSQFGRPSDAEVNEFAKRYFTSAGQQASQAGLLREAKTKKFRAQRRRLIAALKDLGVRRERGR